MAEGSVTLYTQPSEIQVMSEVIDTFAVWQPVAVTAYRPTETTGTIYVLFLDFDSWWDNDPNGSYALVRYDIASRTYIDFSEVTGTAPIGTASVSGQVQIHFFQYEPTLDKLVIIWEKEQAGTPITYAYECTYLSESGGTWSFNGGISSSFLDDSGAQFFCEYFIETDTRMFVAGIARELVSSGTIRFYLFEVAVSGIALITDGDTLPTGTDSISTSSLNLNRGRTTAGFTSMFTFQHQEGDGRLFEIRIDDSISEFADITIEEIWQEPDVDNSETFGRLQDVFWDSNTDCIFLWRGTQLDGGAAGPSILKKIDLSTETVIYEVTHTNMFTARFDKDKHLSWNGMAGCTVLCSGFGDHDGNGTTRRNYVVNLTDGSISKIHAYALEYFGEEQEPGDFIVSFSGMYNIPSENILILDVISNSDWEDTQHADLGSDDVFHILEIETDMFYPNGACRLFGISFGEEKDPNYVDFASI